MQANIEIDEYLRDHGISQAFVSKKTGISPSKLNMALKGNRRLSLEEYSLICGVLGVNIDTFLKPRVPEETASQGGSNDTERIV